VGSALASVTAGPSVTADGASKAVGRGLQNATGMPVKSPVELRATGRGKKS
jgi:hypothetical protein